MPTYKHLLGIVTAVEKDGIRQLHRDQLHAFPALYRRLIAELAEARARGADRAHLALLESVAMRAHAILYAPAPMRLRQSLAEMVRAFPQLVRGAWRPLLLAVILTGVGGAWGLLEVRRAPENATVLLPGELQINAEESFQQGRHGDGSPLKGLFYFTHNASVALNAFSFGATFGVGTILVLLFNGITLGATIAVVKAMGSPQALLAFVLPHSGIELTAIFIAAAGGMRLGYAMLRPGWMPRRYALMLAAREALPLAVGAAAMLSVAGLVEGWISPMPLPLAIKAAIGAALDIGLAAYLCLTPAPRHASQR